MHNQISCLSLSRFTTLFFWFLGLTVLLSPKLCSTFTCIVLVHTIYHTQHCRTKSNHYSRVNPTCPPIYIFFYRLACLLTLRRALIFFWKTTRCSRGSDLSLSLSLGRKRKKEKERRRRKRIGEENNIVTSGSCMLVQFGVQYIQSISTGPRLKFKVTRSGCFPAPPPKKNYFI